MFRDRCRIQFLVAILLLGNISCSYERWHYEYYAYVGGPDRNTNGTVAPTEVRFHLAGAEIYFSLDPVGSIPSTADSEVQFRQGPYQFRIGAVGEAGIHNSLIVNEVIFESSLSKSYLLTNPSGFPLQAIFSQSVGSSTNISSASFRFQDELDLDWENNENVRVIVSATVTTVEVEETKIFVLDFYPYLDSGGGIVTV